MNPISDRGEPFAVHEADAPPDGWDDPVRGRLRWRTLFSKGATPSEGMTCGVAEFAQASGWVCTGTRQPEIYYVFAGAGLMSLDGREIPVKAGSAVFIPGMAEHGIRQTGNETLRLFYAFPVNSFDDVEYLFSATERG